MYRGVYIHYFKINSPIFCRPLFSENYLNPQVKINKMTNKHTVNYHPSPSQFISRIHSLILLWTPKEFISPKSFLNFFLNLYIPPWLRRSFKFILLRLLYYICESKNWICSFLLKPPSKILPHHYPLDRQELPIPPEQRFLKIFFPSQKRGERIMELKKLPKLTRVLGSSFDKFHHRCNLYIFILCFVAQKFSFKHAEVWRFLNLTNKFFH